MTGLVFAAWCPGCERVHDWRQRQAETYAPQMGVLTVQALGTAPAVPLCEEGT